MLTFTCRAKAMRIAVPSGSSRAALTKSGALAFMRSTATLTGLAKLMTMIAPETRTLASTSSSMRKISRAKPESVVMLSSPGIRSAAFATSATISASTSSSASSAARIAFLLRGKAFMKRSSRQALPVGPA